MIRFGPIIVVGVAVAMLAALFSSGCAAMFPSKTKYIGAGYSVTPPEYRAQVEAQRDRAEAEMWAIGYQPRHKVKRVEIVDGTVKRPQGWAIPEPASPTGYAGGGCLGNRIYLVRDPVRKTLIDSTIRHEWKHAILDANYFAGKLDAQHAEIQRSEK
jgi:hypothetical protein